MSDLGINYLIGNLVGYAVMIGIPAYIVYRIIKGRQKKKKEKQ